jgi:hypothetical protein
MDRNRVIAQWDTIVQMMSDDIREALHAQDWPEGDNGRWAFYRAYCAAHQAKYGEAWELAKDNPTW